MNSGSRVPHPYLILWGSGVALSCSPEGEVLAEELHGLFAGDTRVLSTYHIRVSGQAWHLLGRSHFGHGTAQWEYQNRLLRDAAGEIGAGTLLQFAGDPHHAEPNPVPDARRVSSRTDLLLERAFTQGLADLHALAIPQVEHPPYIAAGVPWFLTLFGRDPLVAALLSGLDGVWSAKGALAALGELQTNHATS